MKKLERIDEGARGETNLRRKREKNEAHYEMRMSR
jgi:hypothetical protein